MHQISFLSDAPADHLCRALDIARKMGFALARLTLEPTVQKTFAVSMVLDNEGSPAVETLLARLALMVGAHDVKHESTLTAEAGHPH